MAYFPSLPHRLFLFRRLFRNILLVLTLILVSRSLPALSTATPEAVNQNDEATVQRIYEDLIRAIGDQHSDWPVIRVLVGRNRVASFVAEENTIYIDQVALNLSKTFGFRSEAAIAYIIGHELTHFFQKHEWQESGFTSYFMVSVEDFREHREHERQADIYGGFIAQQAGYPAIPIIPALLDAIYRDYRLDENRSADYPSLAERKTLAGESCEIAGDLINTYQTANYLLATGHFSEAYLLYEYVSRSIRFRELFNNLGVASLHAFLRQKDAGWQYPLEIDTYIPIDRSGIFQSERQMIAAAEKNLRLAFQYDPSYVDASIHLVAALDWSDHTSEAEKLLQKLEADNLSGRQKAKLQLMAGIFYGRQDQVEKAQAYFRQAQTGSSDEHLVKIARDNLRFLKRGKNDPVKPAVLPAQSIIETVDNIQLAAFRKFLRTVKINAQCTLQTAEAPNSTLSFLEISGRKFRLQRVHSSRIYTKGVGVGSRREELHAAFPDATFEAIGYQSGVFLVNYKQGLVFKFDAQGVIQEWALFIL